ncbi:PP2C family protein-serine/threonine phosphatase [Kitasatospora sp. NPDC015120]|uniref:PP2C family protein-serine/threonine phosphatase n=1 Tax=Kitasatospora sp. NPDC015120 TaxID=3364023 RepID=UPI0036F452D4
MTRELNDMIKTFALVLDPDGIQDELGRPVGRPVVVHTSAEQSVLKSNLGPGYSSLPIGPYILHHGNGPFEEEANRYAQQLWAGLAGGGRAPFFRGSVFVTGRRRADGTYQDLGRDEITRLSDLADSTKWIHPVGPVVSAAQSRGLRREQCDALAVHRDRASGVWAFVVCDGIGDDEEVAGFVRHFAPLLARSAASTGSPGDAIRLGRDAVPGWMASTDSWVAGTTAVVVTWHPTWTGLRVGWAGDSRAYAISPTGLGELLTTDHNLAQRKRSRNQPVGPNDHHNLLADLRYGEIGERTVSRGRVDRILLCSDGAYQPLEEAGGRLAGGFGAYPATVLDLYPAKSAAGALVSDAVERARVASLRVYGEEHADNATALVVALPKP